MTKLIILACLLALSCLMTDGQEMAQQEELEREKRAPWTPTTVHEFPFHPRPGQQITMSGRFDGDAKRLHWHLVDGEGPSGEADIILIMDTRFAYGDDERTIVLNYRQNNDYGPEIRLHDIPFEQGADFKIVILQGESTYKITVNGQDFYTFIPTLSPLSSYNIIGIAGDITLNNVTAMHTSTCIARQVHETLYSIGAITVVPVTPTIGGMVKVVGIAKENATVINVKLVEGSSIEGNIGLDIRVTYNQPDNVTAAIVANHRENGIWITKPTASNFPSQQGGSFELEIRFKKGEYLIERDDKTIITHPMRLTPISRFNNLIVEGDIVVKSISIESVCSAHSGI